MSEEQPETSQQRKISRRTLAKGVAWAAPAVAVASAAPAHAASVTTTTTTLPPCVAGIENTSTSWDVDGAQYTDCNCRDHVDVRLKFTVSATNCPYTNVQIRVKNNTIANAKWCWTNRETDNDWLTKTATISGVGVTYPPQRLTSSQSTVADGLYYPAYQTDRTRDRLGSCWADSYVGINDGMHINPCSPGPYFQYQVRYSSDNEATWTDWGPTQYWGDRTTVPLPGGCVPGATTTTTTRRRQRSNEEQPAEESQVAQQPVEDTVTPEQAPAVEQAYEAEPASVPDSIPEEAAPAAEG
ncbi:MAG: hypothetical protein ACOX61_04420 [Brooklawnia sp.]